MDRTDYQRSRFSSTLRNNLCLSPIVNRHPLRSESTHNYEIPNSDPSQKQYSTSSLINAAACTHLGLLFLYACPMALLSRWPSFFKTNALSAVLLLKHSRYPNSWDIQKEIGLGAHDLSKSKIRWDGTVIRVKRSEATTSMSWRRVATKK